jgi:hypothetical protein
MLRAASARLSTHPRVSGHHRRPRTDNQCSTGIAGALREQLTHPAGRAAAGEGAAGGVRQFMLAIKKGRAALSALARSGNGGTRESADDTRARRHVAVSAIKSGENRFRAAARSCKAAMVLSSAAIFCSCLAVLISLLIAQKAASGIYLLENSRRFGEAKTPAIDQVALRCYIGESSHARGATNPTLETAA